MNPMLQAALGAILRSGFTFLAGFLVQQGIWQPDEAEKYVGGLVVFVLMLAWSLWQKYRSRLKFLDALDAPAGTSEKWL